MRPIRWLLAVAWVGACNQGFAAVPAKISFQGNLTNVGGGPLEGEHVFGFSLYDQATGGMILWSDLDTLTVNGGQFHSYLGENTPLPASIFTGQALWLETAVDGSVLPERQPLVSVSYSFHAQTADTASVALQAPGGGFPAPDYDSGWFRIPQNNCTRLTHNLGGDTDKYLVDMTARTWDDPTYHQTQNIIGHGDAEFSNAGYFYWYLLTPTTIDACKGPNDLNTFEMRVRIWVLP